MNGKNKTFIFSGGLGNQMFQYACCEELRHLGCDVEIDLSLYRRLITSLGVVIGAHCGPGLLTVFYLCGGRRPK